MIIFVNDTNERIIQKPATKITHIRVAAIQMVSKSDFDANMTSARKLLRQAKRKSVDMAVLPENFLTYGTRPALDKSREVEFVETFAKMAKELDTWIVAGSFPLSYSIEGYNRQSEKVDKPYATSVVFHPDGRVHEYYDKIHLFDADVSDTNRRYRESDDFSHGNRPVVFDSPWGRIGLAICYDLRFPELFLHFAQNSVSIILIPSAFTEATGRDHWEILLRARAIECQCFIVAPNQGGCHNEKLNTWGRSMVVDPWGNILSSLDKGEGVVVADLDLSMIQKICDRMPIASHRRLNVS